MDYSANLNLPYMLPNQAQKHVTLNQALQILDAFVQLRVQSISQPLPPLEPVEGASYILPMMPAAEWASSAKHIACYQDGAWVYFEPKVGMFAWVEDEAIFVAYDGSTWRDHRQISPLKALGVNSDADTSNTLLVKGARSLFDNETGSHRLKINRSGVDETASLLFQTDYQGQAELGLLGAPNLTLKTSADGQSFQSALTVDLTNGYCGYGTDQPSSALHVAQNADARLTIETVDSGTGGGFDIINSADNQNWRVTGQFNLLKVRDHTARLDKLVIGAGENGEIHLKNCGNVGIGTTTPTATLDVDGVIRVGQYPLSGMPIASEIGKGGLAYVLDAQGGSTLAISDGVEWKRVALGPL